MLTLLNLIPNWLLAALVATLAATSCKLKWDNSGLSLEIEKHATHIAQLETSIAQTTALAQRQSADFERTAREAERQAVARASVARRDAASANAELERLQLALAGYTSPRLSASAVTFAPGIDYTDPVPELFLDCSRRYIELAIKADGHVNDVQTLTGAWPQ
jgi:hypothetical protein